MKSQQLHTAIYVLVLIAFFSCNKDENSSINLDVKNNQTDGNFIPKVFEEKYISGTDNFSDYYIVKPPTTDYQQYSDLIRIKKDGEFDLDIYPLEASSGNIETDASSFMERLNPGYYPINTNGYNGTEAEIEKGKTTQGFEYFILKKTLTKQLNENQFDTKDIAVAAIKVDNKVSLIILYQGAQSIRENGDMALSYVLLTIRFKNATAPGITLQNELIGTWGIVGTNASSSYSFYGTNSFDYGGVSEIRSVKDQDFIEIYRTRVGGSGSFSLTGNVLTLKWKATNIENSKILSIVKRKRNDEEWKTVMWTLDINQKDLVCEDMPCLNNLYQPFEVW